MPKLSEIARYVRSKAAGPFWLTVDIFFADQEDFITYKDSAGLTADNVSAVLGLTSGQVKRMEAPDIWVLKFSYPRAKAQGGTFERDMHGGQQYVPLLDIAL
jgi:hypothetical protein